MNLKFWQRFIPEPVKVRKDSTDMSLTEWRKNDNMLAAAKVVLTNHTFTMMWDVLENEHPRKLYMPPEASLERRGIRQAEIQGYERALDTIRAMAVPLKEFKPIESTFGAGPKPKEIKR